MWYWLSALWLAHAGEVAVRSTVEGIAENTKAGAVVVRDDGTPTWVQGLDRWPAELDGQRVVVTGVAIVASVAPEATVDEHGAWSQGVAPGTPPAPTLAEATWRAVNPVPAGPWQVVFADGSGNRTVVEGEGSTARFRYEPVTPELSSSGTYSGGAPAAGVVPADRVGQLWAWIESVRGDPTVVARRREKGTGALRVVTAFGETDLLLIRAAALGFVAPEG
jgi:hypothetical protein